MDRGLSLMRVNGELGLVGEVERVDDEDGVRWKAEDGAAKTTPSSEL